jgi:tellurite resistance protein TerB
MSFWNNLRDKANGARAAIASEVAQFRNRTFMEAAVAACAVIAAADGEISSKEKQKMAGFIRMSEELKVFDMNEVIAFFEKMTGQMEFDVELGRAGCMGVIGKLKGKDKESRLVVRVAIAIGASDGNFDEKEKQAVRMICRDLGLNPADFDL